ncbi:adenylate cyclase, type IX, putative [Brugia malayi]|uniref:adenylate cyclase n=2 Tax=Brugia TaxID=6278 RepID=A0A0H5S1F7_BRUMA|nr:adenylate cyclase, type IX, putative [Brugia malayi]CRZ22548.1 BMA-ACY-1 [Brugia malayi]VIO92580.1 adenylate cyclase, type IX, putative [Brugia malayi]
MRNDEEDENMVDEAVSMLAAEAASVGIRGVTGSSASGSNGSQTPIPNGSSGEQHPITETHGHSISPPHASFFERVSTRWWNPHFSSTALETQYWKCSFPQLRDRFRSGLVYICLSCILWIIYLEIFNHASLIHWLISITLFVISFGMFLFTLFSVHYQRFYMPASFLCVFILCTVTLLIFSDKSGSFMSPIGDLATSFQVVLLIYTVVPLPLYLCICIGLIYSILFEMITAGSMSYGDTLGVKLILHFGINLLGVHLFILTQVRQRKTFLRVGQSLLARKDLEMETQLKDHMIQSVMPKKVADELLKETNVRRSSASQDAYLRTTSAESAKDHFQNTREANASAGTLLAPNVRKFRPFTMNLMTNVSIIFADIAGFTKMSSNKSASELVNLLNDLFGRFDYLCGLCNLEKISTLGDCYYCVAGCPEPRADHARCCVEMGLAMILAIQQFDEDRGQDVNMRVGIHTGKVLCGMVGMKRFKFDVFSNDVTLANEMESTGIAGRIHISEVTAKFLNNEYILEDGPDYAGMKTYFIAGRVRDMYSSMNKTNSCSNSVRDIFSTGSQINHSQISFRKRLTNKIKMMQTTSIPVERYSGNLKMKRLERKCESNSAQILHHSECLDKNANSKSPVIEKRRKSASLHALHPDDTKSFSIIDQLDSKMSRELLNGSSRRNSKSSGMQDSISDTFSCAGPIETAISYHQNAPSLTRFDTDDRAFDERLAIVIQNSDINFNRGFWMRNDWLNRWTLRFNEVNIEERYRAHFAESADHQWPSCDVGRCKNASQIDNSDLHYHYSGVFIDVLVAGMLLVICAVAILVSGMLNTIFIIYFTISLIATVLIIIVIGIPLIRRQTIFPFVNLWTPRHITGMVLILLPAGVALTVAPLCDDIIAQEYACISPNLLTQRILFSYIFLVALFAHCNFSQLSAWPKTAEALLVGIVFLWLTYVCQYRIGTLVDKSSSNSNIEQRSCNGTVPLWASGRFGSPINLPEICIDVFLVVVLVAFLNYQFEAAFRMSFFGDVQAQRDMRQMQAVRDQADWLLTNIIPQHAIDSLKSSIRYSKNHALTAVLFATITNWNEMYEETFEGGREFLRVLNEIIGDFDELLDRPDFSQVEKIKTIGPTYMAAAGLNPDKRRSAQHPYEHLYQLMEFAIGLQQQLNYFNQDLLNFDFVCKIGYNIGPVTAGVIGTTKLYYDIWGDTVNIASRMYSTGVQNRIQVSQKTRDLLCDRYDFEYRDHIEVKGVDGGMDTYLLVGRKGEPPVNFTLASTF